jgi:hypothetical protein
VSSGKRYLKISIAFHLKANDRERYVTISLVDDDKQDYNLHFLIPEDKDAKGLSGELSLTSSNREDEPFSIPISFAYWAGEVGRVLRSCVESESYFSPFTK